MLVLSRQVMERIDVFLDGRLVLTITNVGGKPTRLGLESPLPRENVVFVRRELVPPPAPREETRS